MTPPRPSWDTVSLLWPQPSGSADAASRLGVEAAADLGIGELALRLSFSPEDRAWTERLLGELCTDAAVIRYRQEILDDVMASPQLEEGLAEFVPRARSLARYRAPAEKRGLLFEVTWRLGELERYVDAVGQLASALERAGPGLRSEGLGGLREQLERTRQDPVFRRLREELPDLRARIRGIASLTIGINLDGDLQPAEVVLLSLNDQRFGAESPSFFRRLFAGSSLLRQWTGVAPLHRAAPAGRAGVESGNPMLVPLFRDLSQVLQAACRPVATALQHYSAVGSGFLAGIGQELSFYLGAARLFRTLRADGLPFCRPDVAPAGERLCELRGTGNVVLAARFHDQATGGSAKRQVVTSDAVLGPGGAVLILTGPNHGGKTTWMQAVGQAQVLAQAGLLVPGSRAKVSPADAVLTHFPAAERPEAETGRLGEEAQRLREIFTRATPESLVLLNESLTATSPRESFLLARDVVRALRVLGARSIFTTHLHELAAEADALNAETDGEARISSVVALVGEPSPGGIVRRTYRVVARPPAGSSDARGIALRHGISFEQLVDCLRGRGVVGSERLAS